MPTRNGERGSIEGFRSWPRTTTRSSTCAMSAWHSPSATASRCRCWTVSTYRSTPARLSVSSGRSGSGKSTLLRIAAGLIKPTSGEVIYRGVPLTEPAEGIAVVFQTFALFPWLTVLENVEAGLDAAGIAARTGSSARAGRHRPHWPRWISSPRIRASCRAECVNASASPEPRRQGPMCC